MPERTIYYRTNEPQTIKSIDKLRNNSVNISEIITKILNDYAQIIEYLEIEANRNID